MGRVARVSFLLAVLVIAGLPFPAATVSASGPFANGITTRVSVKSSGAQSTGNLGNVPVISADGRWVAFFSTGDLVADPTTGGDVYLHDRVTHTTTLVPRGLGGVAPNGQSFYPSISGDGRFIAFNSHASNLVANDTNGQSDVFVFDRLSGTIELVSVSSSGQHADRGGTALSGAISSDGRFVTFASAATNLVPGDTNGFADVFVHDRVTGETTRVSVGTDGSQGNDNSSDAYISGDGQIVAFRSETTNFPSTPPISAGHISQVWARDRSAGTTTLVSVTSSGVAVPFWGSGLQAISANGRFIAFDTRAKTTSDDDPFAGNDLFVRDRVAGTTILASVSSVPSSWDTIGGSLSADGRYVAWATPDPSVVLGDANRTTDVFVRDLVLGTNIIVSLNTAGAQANGASAFPNLSGDGKFIVFYSGASNLVSGDTNHITDAFVRELVTNTAPSVAMANAALLDAGVALTLSGSFSDPDAGDSWTAVASYGDGSSGSIALAPDKTFIVTHTYSGPGTFSLVVTVTDHAGASGSATTTVTVTEPTSDPIGSSFGGEALTGLPLAEPVNSFSGNFGLSVTDLDLPARGLPLRFVRSYNALDARVGVLGGGWSTMLDANLHAGIATAVATRPDGRRDIFVRQPDGTYRPPSSVFDDLARNADGTWTLTQRDRVRLDFDAAGALTRITDRNTNTLAFERDASARATRVVDAAGRALAFSYDGAGQLAEVTDAAGRRVTYGHAAGRLTTVTDAAGALTTYAYDASARLTTITDALGHVVLTNVYDASGRVVTQTNAVGSTIVFAYDATTHVTTITDARGGATRITHDTVGRAVRSEDAGGAATISEFDGGGSLVSFRDRNGNQWRFSYDERGNRTGVTDPAGGTASFTYDALNDLLSRTDPNGNAWRYAYDARGNLVSVSDPEAGTTRIEVDSSGLPLRITDADGVATVYEYDGAGQLKAVTTAAGTTTSSYDAAGRLVRRVDANGHDMRFTYDAVDRLLRTTDAVGNSVVLAYDAAGDLLSTTDRSGATTAYNYDAAGRVVTTIDPLGGSTTFAYDANGNRAQATDPAGKTTRFAYDARDRLVAVTDAEGATSHFAYDANGNLIATTDARGGATSISVDFRNQRTAVQDRVGSRTTYAYDAAGRLVSTSDPLGATTRLGYDRADRYTSTTDPLGNTARVSYTPAGRRLALIDAKGNVTSLEYDAAGRLVRTSDALGGRTSLVYDPVGNVSARTDPLGRTTSYGYDALDRLVTITDALGQRSLRRYDANGALASLTDALGNTTAYAYDVAGRLTKVTDALGGSTSYAYDVRGLLTDLADANGHSRTYTYDGNRRMLTEADALARVRTYVYDANGNVVATIDPKGQRTTFQYDGEDRLVAAGYADGTTVGMTRDAAGDRVRMVDAVGMTRYEYDALRRPVAVTDPFGNTVRYGYEANGQRASLTYPDGRTASYGYDAVDRLVGVTFDGATSRYTYDAVGNAIAGAFPNGSRFDATYDPLDRATSLTHRDGQGKVVSAFSYNYDAAGNVVRERATGARDLNEDRAYSYDALSRLIGVSANGQAATYGYDAAGNRTSSRRGAGPAEIATFDTADQLVRITRGGATHGSFTYDANGNLTSRAQDDAVTKYAWDAADRLAAVATPDGAVSAFDYDGDGNLWRETRTTDDGASRTLTYALDLGGRLSQMLSVSDGHDQVAFLYGLRRIAALGSDTRYYGLDARGSVRTLTDADGRLTGTRGYDAWGGRSSNDASANERGIAALAEIFGYTGERQDPATGLLYLRDRWYAPDAGRFVSADKFRGLTIAPRTLNGYAYGFDNPVRFVDPTGFAPSDLFNGSIGYSYDSAAFYRDPSVSPSDHRAFSQQTAYAIAQLFADLDSSDPWTQAGALGKVSLVGIGVAVPVALALPEEAVAGFGGAVTAGATTVAAGVAGLFQRAQSLLSGASTSASRLSVPARSSEVAAPRLEQAASRLTAAETALARPIFVIGESSSRVERFAERVGGESYAEDEATRVLSLGERAIANLQALTDKMTQGYAIYDIGLDPDRPQRGFFYFVETGLMNASQYPFWVQIRGPE
jgi:RHS repeat-associated protein